MPFDNVHPLFAAVLRQFSPLSEPLMHEHTVVAADLQPGDDLLDTVIGGYSGRIYSVHVDEPRDRVRVIFEAPSAPAEMSCWEICTVHREALREAFFAARHEDDR